MLSRWGTVYKMSHWAAFTVVLRWIKIKGRISLRVNYLKKYLMFYSLLKKSFFSQTPPWANKSKILSAVLVVSAFRLTSPTYL